MVALPVKPDETSQDLCEALSALLKEERAKAGLSANRLAELAGLNRQAITFIERGERIPSIDTFSRIALAMNLKPSDLWLEAERRVM